MKRKLIAAIGVASMYGLDRGLWLGRRQGRQRQEDRPRRLQGPDADRLGHGRLHASRLDQGPDRSLQEEDRRHAEVPDPAVERHPAEARPPPSPSRPRRTSSRSATPRPRPTRPAGGLADLSDLKQEIGGDWVDALNKSSVFDGKQYAAPWYFANRVVIYNKKVWADAGIKDTPKTRDEFFKDLDAIKKKGKAEPIYLPGQNWYFFDGLTIGQGADLVKKEGDKYVSNLADPKVAAAMELYKKYQAYSKAPKDKDEATPQQAEVFAKGNVGAFIGMGWEAGTAIEANTEDRGATSATSPSRVRPPTSPRASSSAAPTSRSPRAARSRTSPRSS